MPRILSKNLSAYALEFILIFLSVLGSFLVANHIDNRGKSRNLVSTLVSLRQEVQSNIKYGLEHKLQLENILAFSDEVIEAKEPVNFETLKEIHRRAPFVHNLTSNGSFIYLTAFQKEEIDLLFLWTNAWEPQDIFYESIRNSGNLLLVENDELIRKLDFNYNKQGERINGFYNLRRELSLSIREDVAVNLIQKKIQAKSEYFLNYHSNDFLRYALDERVSLIKLSIQSIADYVETLQEIELLLTNTIKRIS